MTRFPFSGFTIFFILIGSCESSVNKSSPKVEEIKLRKSYNYRITVDIWNGFYSHESKFILDNSLIDFDDSSYCDGLLTKPLTLYYITYKSIIVNKRSNTKTLVPVDTAEIKFSKELSDTMFVLTNNFMRNFSIKNYDTVAQLIPIVKDDSQGSIEISKNGRKQIAAISSINNPTIGSVELDTLLNFVLKFEPTSKYQSNQ